MANVRITAENLERIPGFYFFESGVLIPTMEATNKCAITFEGEHIFDF
jgi:hypothetical protein